MPKPEGNGNGGGKGGGGDALPAGAISGTEGADIINLSSTIASTLGDDAIYGLGGDDDIFAGDGNDTVDGGAGNDTLDGGAGDDEIYGGDGGDLIMGSPGSDTIDGGGGHDVVMYYGSESDYDITVLTEIQGNGKKAQEVIVGYEVLALDGSGDIDYISNVEQVLIVELPPAGTITTQGDYTSVLYDQTVVVDVLANDYLEGGNLGEGLTISGIIDVQIDVDGDGVNDVDLIPDGADLAYFTAGGLLNDGSILTVNPDNTITWDPNGQYDVEPGAGEDAPVVHFWYEVEDAGGATEFGDLTIQVTYPAAPGDIAFEDMVSVYDDFTANLLGLWIYQDGPNGSYWISQLSSGTGTFEQRDEGATSFDYDMDGDDEFRIWTEADGTTHEMNVAHEGGSSFGIDSMTFVGLDAGEEALIVFSDGSGNPLGQVTITEADLDANGVVEFTNATGIEQFNVIAGDGDEFYVDDIFLI